MNGGQIMVNSAFSALADIESERSTNYKKSVLTENKDNQILFNFLYWTYNPFYHYYMNKIKYTENDFVNEQATRNKNYIAFRHLLKDLNKRVITGNKAIESVSNFLSKCDFDEQKWYTRILSRDLKIGVNTTTINHIWEDAIPIFPVALADKMRKPYFPARFCVEQKFDGYRCLTHCSKHGANMYSRNGRSFEGYDEIVEIFERCFPKGFYYDGELISGDFKGSQQNAFRKSSGKKSNYYVFDIVREENFVHNDGYKPLIERKEELAKAFESAKAKAEKLGVDISCISLVPYIQGYGDDNASIDKAYDCLNVAKISGWEGIMLKDLDSLYMSGKSYSSACGEDRKSPKWFAFQKMKVVTETYDLLVVDVYKGTGKNKGRLGGVYCEYVDGEGRGHILSVGSGFSDSDRDYYWKNKNEIIGHFIEIESDGETMNDDGGRSLRFPVFKRIRKDKG